MKQPFINVPGYKKPKPITKVRHGQPHYYNKKIKSLKRSSICPG